MRKENLRILVVDDSAVVRSFLKNILQSDENINVVGMATNGQEAITIAAKLKPDLITMDINMPVLDGFAATEQIMYDNPTPIVIVSGNYAPSDVAMTFNALKVGAVSILPKPAGLGSPDFEASSSKFLEMIWLMSEIKVVRKHRFNQTSSAEKANVQIPASKEIKLIAIGASAGGPLVLQKILKGLPENLAFPILIVQHVDTSFNDGFANWLKETSNKSVKLAQNGEPLQKGVIYLASADHHLGIHPNMTIQLSNTAAIHACRPSVSYLFGTVLKACPQSSLAILLTGMGKDGAEELKQLKDAGSTTIAQDKESSLVHGMPGEAIKLGGATLVMSPDEISEYIKSLH